MSKPVFYDPDRKRWKRLRLLINVAGVLSTLLVVFFAISLSRDADIPNLLLPEEKRPYHQLREKDRRHINRSTAHRRKPGSKASELVLNSGEPVRAAFYVQWDAGSYASLREYGHQIDLLFPEFLHVLTADGHLQGVTDDNRIFDVMQGTKVTPVDTKVMNFLRSEKLPVEVFPLVNNYNPINKEWVASVGKVLGSAAARQHFREQMAAFLQSDTYRGLTLDFEEIPTPAQPGFRALIAELASDLHARGMKLYVAVPADNEDFDYRYIAATSDGAIVMNYDQHFPEGAPGAIAGQEWFVKNLQHALKVMPREKLICAIASYGYDWPRKKAPAETVENLSVQGAWLTARESEADIDFHADSLNPHFEYADGQNIRHDVWFTDAVTAVNEMRAARNLGISTFALWRLGSED